jgi:coenzyme F420-0:L-glutamate ligase/coenzyme F420-1:gamma-L-glutamate ligase
LPEDPDVSARGLRERIRVLTGTEVAIVISDSFGRPFRRGTTGVAVGVAGLEPVVEYIGEPDDAGRPFHSTRVHVADQIAAAADLLLGPRGRVPAVLIRGAPIAPGDGESRDGVIPADRDLFA